MNDKLLDKFEKFKYKVKVKDDKLNVIEIGKVYEIKNVDNGYLVNNMELNNEEFDKLFFKNIKVNKAIFACFSLIITILYIWSYFGFDVANYNNYINAVISNFSHTLFLHYFFNLSAMIWMYVKLKHLSPKIILMIISISLTISTIVIYLSLLNDSQIIGASGILFGFSPFLFLEGNVRSNLYIDLIVLGVLLNLPAMIIPFLSAKVHFAGYLGGAIIYIYCYKRDLVTYWKVNKNEMHVYYS